jgi:predicted dehydrogenase
MTQRIDRRRFLRTSIAATATLGAAPGLFAVSARAAAGRTIGPNEEIRFAVVGFNGQGGSHLSSLRDLRDKAKVRVVALCDVDSAVLDKGVKSFADKDEKVAGYTDIRKLIENPDVDAISIATPNHWHALATIWAVQAGKDVYVEKPVSHNVSEGRRMVEAARKYQRIVQTGTQSRSSSGIGEAVDWVRAGNLGKILVSRGLCYKRRASIGKVDGPQPIPPQIDYDLWCGPAPKDPLTRRRLHYDWHWVWPTGNGDLGNQGIHEMDVARWFLGETALSPRILSVGGRLGYVDDGTTPNTLIIFHAYAKAPLIFEVRGLPERAGADKMGQFQGAGIGIVIHCEGGHVLVPNYTSAIAFDKSDRQIRKFQGSESHHGNFIKAVRSRKSTDLNADILEGHLSSALCHTGNISYRLGRLASPDEIRAGIRGQPDAEDTFGRMLEHLELNEVDLAATQATLGMPLVMDPATERFVGNADADKHLTRDYRAPFVVPAKV